MLVLGNFNNDGIKIIEDIAQSFYKKEAVKELVDNCKNANAIETLAKMYADATSNWEMNMSKMSKFILDNASDKNITVGNINVNFTNNTVSIQNLDTGCASALESSAYKVLD